MNKNRDHVAVHPFRDPPFWALVVPSGAETCEEQTCEMATLCEQFFDTFDEFVTPTAIEFDVPCFPEGHKLPASAYDDAKLKTVHRELRNLEGIGIEEVLAAFRVDDCPSRWIPHVIFEGVDVLVELEDGPVVANRASHTVGYDREQPNDDGPIRDPLEVKLLHGPNSWKSALETEFVTSVLVKPVSDIWFEETELGRANARHLAAFLERIERMLPVEKVERYSDRRPVEELEAIF